jgi:hypothetical protein
MTDDVSDLVLEGNSAVTLLQELFACDITVARTQCEACGSIEGVGSLRRHGAPMGAVLRCSHCDGILMRAVHTPHGRWLKMKGARYPSFQSSM